MTNEPDDNAQNPVDVALSDSQHDMDKGFNQIHDPPAPDKLAPVEVSSAEAPTYSYSEPFSKNITRSELIAGVLIVLFWVVFFTLGLFVPTEAMRNALWSGTIDSVAKTIGYALFVGVSYTLTNILFLSCLASLLGCMAYRWQVGDGFNTIPPNARSVAATRIYLSAVLRGFFLYLMFISGFLVVATQNTVMQTEFTQYVRIAGMMSIVGFIVGYDPNVLLGFIRRILTVASFPLDETAERRADLLHSRGSAGDTTLSSGGHPRSPK